MFSDFIVGFCGIIRSIAVVWSYLFVWFMSVVIWANIYGCYLRFFF